jgi:ATP-dependent RNA helicase RhlE
MKNNIKIKKNLEIKTNDCLRQFSDLGVSQTILDVLIKLELKTPTPIQEKTIPTALKGQDLIGVAQTGTGKTFAFGIPMLQRLGLSKGQGLIITPTRELALQVEDSLNILGQALGLRTASLIGGEFLDRQLFRLRKNPHIIVATPGRLLDHLKRRTFKLDRVDILVLDEADMMLDLGFAPQIKEILSQAPIERQTMLFSATMPVAIVKIAEKYMKLPVSIEVATPGTTASLVDQEIFIINNEKRLEHLEKVLNQYTGSVLVFVRTKHGVKTLNKRLQAIGHQATEIHSNLSLGRRREALNSFKSRKKRILVATDVAARGLDINNIELVVNYNMPDNSEDYVHRIGRTGRADKAGKAITFATINQYREIKAIERLINKDIKQTHFVKSFQKIISNNNESKYRSKKSFRKRPQNQLNKISKNKRKKF